MGREGVKFSVTAVLSRHNSLEDTRDNLLWEQLCREIEEIVRKPKYEKIRADTL